MARIAGIQVERSIKGVPLFIRIDLRKHPDFIPFFEDKGIIEEQSPYNPKFVEKIRQSEKEDSISLNLEKYGIEI